MHDNSLGAKYLMIGAENFHALVEIGNHPTVEKELMQMSLNDGQDFGTYGVLKLYHGCPLLNEHHY